MAIHQYFARFACFVLFFLFFFLTKSGFSEIAPMPLSRQQAIKMSVSKHPRLVASSQKVDAASARIGQAKAGFMPQISFVERYSRTNNPMWAFGTKLNQESITQADFDPRLLNDPDDIDNFVSTIDVKWPLFDSGQTWYGWRQAKKGFLAAEIQTERVRQEIIGGAALSYDGLLLASARLEVIDQAIGLAKAHLKLVEERYRAGFVVKSDLLRARVRLSDLKQKRFEAESGVAVGMAALGAAIGFQTDHRFLPTDSLKMEQCYSESVDEWISTALEKRPELRLLSIQEEMAQYEVKKQTSQHFPAISLFGNYEINSERFDDTGDNFTVGAMMQVNLFSGGKMVSQAREARAALAEVQAHRQSLVSNIEVEVRKAFHEACSAKQRIGVAEETVTLAKESRRIVEDRYASGLLTIVDLLDAETTIENARNNLYQALHDYRVSHIRLQLASGVLDVPTE